MRIYKDKTLLQARNTNFDVGDVVIINGYLCVGDRFSGTYTNIVYGTHEPDGAIYIDSLKTQLKRMFEIEHLNKDRLL